MKDYPYFKAYVAEILFDTMGMTRDKKGDYLDSLLMSWKTMDPSTMPEWMREYADETIIKSRKLSENSKVRWSKAMQLHTNCKSKAMQTPYIEERIGEDRRREEIKIAFASFWIEYPKKVSKPQAEKAFKNAVKKTKLEPLLKSLDAFKLSEDWTKENGKYIPNPATWLNGERWNDNQAPVVPQPGYPIFNPKPMDYDND